jgi:L-alanine-DL-glutamate epimerase-like enolase superfamily enzyme
VQSLEQPLPAGEPDLAARLERLFRQHGVPLMADESVCSAADIEAWPTPAGYRLVNVRVGKCGGLLGARAARRRGLGLTGGTLVGESAILDRHGGILLGRTDDLPYMEGLGQHRWLLAGEPPDQPAAPSDDYEHMSESSWINNQPHRWQVTGSKHLA